MNDTLSKNVNATRRLQMNCQKSLKGFTLLEVMVAMAILGLSFTAVFHLFTHSMRLAVRAKNLTIATTLTRQKIFDCKEALEKENKGDRYSGYFKKEGDFADLGYENFRFKCYSYPFEMPAPNMDQIAAGLKEKGPEGMGLVGASAGLIAPVVRQLATALRGALRELVVIVSWQEGKNTEKIEVATHVIRKRAMVTFVQNLNTGLPAGAPATNEQDKDKKPQEQKPGTVR